MVAPSLQLLRQGTCVLEKPDTLAWPAAATRACAHAEGLRKNRKKVDVGAMWHCTGTVEMLVPAQFNT